MTTLTNLSKTSSALSNSDKHQVQSAITDEDKIAYYLLAEDGTSLLLENGGKIILDLG